MKNILFLIILFTGVLQSQDSLQTKSRAHIDTTCQNRFTKTELFNPLNKIRSSEFNAGIKFSPLSLVQGRVPGFNFNIININDPNPKFSFQVRGLSSLVSESNPIFLLDDVPINSYDFIMAENIESIELHSDMVSAGEQDFSSTSGMVSINSREISDTNLVLSYNTYSYFESFKKKYYRNTEQFRERIAYWKKFENYTPVNELSFLHDFGSNTDWLNTISQHKFNQSHNFAIGKRIHNTSFNLMLTYKDFNGIIRKNSNQILNGHLVLSQTLFKDMLKINATLIVNKRNYQHINFNPAVFVDGSTESNIISYAEVFNPTVLPQDQEGNYHSDTIYKTFVLQNPLEVLNNSTDSRSSITNFAVINTRFQLIKGLSLSLGYSMMNDDETINLSGKIKETSNPFLLNSRYLTQENDLKQSNYIATLNYNYAFKKHTLDLGISNRLYISENDHFLFDSTKFSDLSFRIIKSRLWENYSLINVHPYISYSHTDLFTLNAGLNNSLVKSGDYFKDTLNFQPHIRASLSLHRLIKNINWLSNIMTVGSFSLKKEPNTLKNTLTSWKDESAKCYDLGIEASFLQNKIYFSMKYYNKMIFNTLNIIPGFFGPLYKQFDIENSGLELQIKSNYKIKNFSFVQEFCFTHNKSNQIYHGSDFAKYPKDIAVNVGDFEGKYFAGFSDTIDVNIFTPFYFTDDGGTTSNANKAKTGVLGNGIPKYFIGVFSKITYKRIEFSILLKSAFGFEIRNLEYIGVLGTNNIGKNITVTVPSNYIHSLKKDTDYGVLKGGYTKIDNVTLKYTIPIKALKISTFKVYFSVINPYIFSHNYGIDGEMLNISAVEPGILYYKNYPETIIYQLGFGVKF